MNAMKVGESEGVEYLTKDCLLLVHVTSTLASNKRISINWLVTETALGRLRRLVA